MLEQPYDRERTCMAMFRCCPDCLNEYRNPQDRRFHAQTIACPNCGPYCQLLNQQGEKIAERETAIRAAVQALADGQVLAVKGIGGFQLLVDGNNNTAIARLRKRKGRPHKPFAIMVKDIETALQIAYINEQERQALLSPSAPIVLLSKRANKRVDSLAAPDSALLGILLPYSPLHHLLLQDFYGPLIATSGNRQSEPICIASSQALATLKDIADLFLTHNRTILRPLDDSIVREIGGKMTVLRRARGYAPLPIEATHALPDLLAVGGQLKNSIAISRGQQIILSQHIGDLNTLPAQQQFSHSIADLQQFYAVHPTRWIHDLHPGYHSSQHASRSGLPLSAVQHHHAHLFACMAEHQLQPPLLGIAWDGNGLGGQQQLWGGEFFLCSDQGFSRFAYLQPFPLPGAGKAIQEPQRAALGLLYTLYGDTVFTKLPVSSLKAWSRREQSLLLGMLQNHINAPQSSSAGRLFDAVASLLNLCQVNTYEGQAAMLLEAKSDAAVTGVYPFKLQGPAPLIIDWRPCIQALLADLETTEMSTIAAKFHNTLAAMILQIAQKAEQDNIVLSGGCFQNDKLTSKCLSLLKTAGFSVFTHEKIPPNDGGLALGQLYALQYQQMPN